MARKSYVQALAVLCVVLLAPSAWAAVLLDRVVAVVNQEVITWSELYRSMETDASPQLKALKEDERRKVFKESEAEFLETLINTRLQMQEARKTGVGVSEEELNEAIESIKAKYSMTDEAFRASLKGEGFSYEGYRQRLRDQITISKVVNQQVRSKIIVKDEEVKKFMAENREALDTAGTYRIRQIFFKLGPEGNRGILEERAGEILGRLKEGEGFSDLARQFSDDPSAKMGGDLGHIKKNHLSGEFLEALAGMKRGDVSKPFWTKNGLHIIMLEEAVESRDNPIVREEAQKILSTKLFAERYEAWIKSLREKSFIEIRL